MNDISVIFPIAGLGSRFNYSFKPLLKATEECFIELAKKPFDQLKLYNYDIKYYFIFRRSQNLNNYISLKLKELFSNDNIECLIIDIDTNGPLQTLQYAIKKYNVKGLSFVCDCDHMININPFINKLNNMGKTDIVIPYWNISVSDYNDFGKIKIDKYDNILDFCEKEHLDDTDNGIIKGLIGCYLFKNIEMILNYPNYENISSMLKDILIQNSASLSILRITDAAFFGTPEKLQDFRFNRALKYSLFIDIDGTIINQENKQILPFTNEKLDYWSSLGHKIILTTANNETYRDKITDMLNTYNIKYDFLIMNLSPGPRIIINDKKPYLPYYRMAKGIDLIRNTGLCNIDIPETPPKILKIFKGASFAKVYLLQDNDNKKFVRKYIYITYNNLIEHVNILKRQCSDISRFNYYKTDLCPNIINEVSNNDEYYYDMEYLEGYDKLSTFDNNVIFKIIKRVNNDLEKYVYVFNKKLNINESLQWLQTYLDEKIFPKFKIISENYPDIYKILNGEITINNIKYKNIFFYLNNINMEKIIPEYLSPIHGDLTAENIMYNNVLDDYKLIDMAGSRYVDAKEMDIAKVFQSIICEYSSWDTNSTLFEEIYENNFIISDIYLKNKYDEIKDIYNETQYFKGIFYMSTYFIRMIPYLINVSHNQAKFIAILSIYYLNLTINNIR